MKTSLVLALAVAVALSGCSKSTRTDTAAADSTAASSDYTASTATSTTAANLENSMERTGDRMARTGDQMSNDIRNAANSAGNAMAGAANDLASSARMMELNLTADDIRADLQANREIVRTKDAASTPTGNVDSDTIESSVKSRLSADSSLANLDIEVDADRRGEVKLSGKAASAEQVGRAIALALGTEGVTKVSSKIKLDEKASK